MGHNDHFEENEFENFLQEIINNSALEGVAEGITKLVIDKGESGLTKKQAYVFNTQVKDLFITDECSRCGLAIPWCEMFVAHENGGLCSWCDHQVAKGN